MKTAFFILLSVLLLGALFYAVTASRVAVDKEKIEEACLAEVATAQEQALSKICTQEVRVLLCGADLSFSYEAQNGCEISYLFENGWRYDTLLR